MFVSQPAELARKILTTFLVSGLFGSALAEAPRPAVRSSRALTTPRVLEFEALPLERLYQNHLLVRGWINGKAAALVVDTGAPISLIAANRVSYFGVNFAKGSAEIPASMHINGAVNSMMMARSLRLGSLNLIDEPLVAIDLGDLGQNPNAPNGNGVDGIIGTDILFPTGAVLDCRAQRLFLKLDPNVRGQIPGLDLRGFTAVPVHVSDGSSLYVDGKFNGRRAQLRIDTGAFGTLMHTNFVRTMRIPLRPTRSTSAPLILKQRQLHVATISRFSIGAVDMRNKQVGVTNLDGILNDNPSHSAGPDAGLLGAEILQEHSAIIDFGARTLYLKPATTR